MEALAFVAMDLREVTSATKGVRLTDLLAAR
jgi:hypothetical protein